MEVKIHTFLNSTLPDSCKIKNVIDTFFLKSVIYHVDLMFIEYRFINRLADMRININVFFFT